MFSLSRQGHVGIKTLLQQNPPVLGVPAGTGCPIYHNHHTTTILRPFFWDHPREPMPEENLWTLWCKGTLTEADTQTIRQGATPSGLTSAHLHHAPHFLQASSIKHICYMWLWNMLIT